MHTRILTALFALLLGVAVALPGYAEETKSEFEVEFKRDERVIRRDKV
ncbi:MAG: hypothetical protein O2954_15690 [bacterium]|nr:hypothetical protein [bacterium]